MLTTLTVDVPPGVLPHNPRTPRFLFPEPPGKRVASVRRSLATLFSIPAHAEPWVAGSVVGADYRLRPGDSVEFLVRHGRKGVGQVVWTAEQFCRVARIPLSLKMDTVQEEDLPVLPLMLLTCLGPGEPIRVKETPAYVQIDTDALQARINKKGYVSGVAAGSLLDKKTGATTSASGCTSWTSSWPPAGATTATRRRTARSSHGELFPKHYVEGPQICTQAKELKPEVIRGKDFVAVRMGYTFTKPGAGFKAGSRWEQTLVFQNGLRYFLSSEKITSVNDVKELFYRIDMPGHIRHKGGDTFSQIYLSYLGKPLPASAFAEDFGPDAKYLYQRKAGKIPKRMIRAYQVKVKGKPGPWLGGLTLDPAATSEAWCHQRGYVCFIEELHRKDVKAGESFGAAYAVGWFDDIAAMEKVCDEYKGKKGDPGGREGVPAGVSRSALPGRPGLQGESGAAGRPGRADLLLGLAFATVFV